MTSIARLALSPTFLFAGLALATTACGGGDDDPGVTPIVDASIDAVALDAPPACNAPSMTCSGECIDVTSDEEHCGNCTTACTVTPCLGGTCMCPAAFLATNSTISSLAVTDQIVPGAITGLGSIDGAVTLNALVVAYPSETVATGMAYPLTPATLGDPPFAALAYDLDIAGMSVTAAYYATEGTLTFNRICEGGFSGVLTNVKFSAVDGLLSGAPTLVPGGCAVPATGTLASVPFALGTACPAD